MYKIGLLNKNIRTFSKFNDALEYSLKDGYDNILAIGGVGVYKEALEDKRLKYIYWNEVLNTDKKCNIFFPYDRLNSNNNI